MDKRDNSKIPKSSPVSLFSLLKLGLFDSAVCKPREPRGICPVDTSHRDGGRTGASVVGSCVAPLEDDNDLPSGAINPGLLRHIHNAARYRTPQCFEGAYVSAKQNVSCNWVVGHTMQFSSVSPGGYKILLSYADKGKPWGVPYFVVEGAPGGQISCETRVGPTRSTRATVTAQMADQEVSSFESSLDAYFKCFTTSIIAVNRELIAVHYLQRLSENLSLGGEILARGPCADLGSAMAAARWTDERNALSATLGSRGLDLCYARALGPALTLAAMLEVGFPAKRSVCTLAYEWNAAEWTTRASADSDGLVGATLERKLGGGQKAELTCVLSALLNHPNNKFRLGFGVNACI